MLELFKPRTKLDPGKWGHGFLFLVFYLRSYVELKKPEINQCGNGRAL
jgi:hypothetical protein